jgi:hypothetical protein
MDTKATLTTFREYGQLIEDMWIEADCYRTLLIHYHHVTSEQLDEVLANTKRDPAVRNLAEAKFAQLRKQLDILDVQAALEVQQSSPLPKDKEN